MIQHARAREIYGERRAPRTEIKKAWPRRVRTGHARFRTGHAKELKKYRRKIDKGEDVIC